MLGSQHAADVRAHTWQVKFDIQTENEKLLTLKPAELNIFYFDIRVAYLDYILQATAPISCIISYTVMSPLP